MIIWQVEVSTPVCSIQLALKRHAGAFKLHGCGGYIVHPASVQAWAVIGTRTSKRVLH